jgi:hypothetical protein
MVELQFLNKKVEHPICEHKFFTLHNVVYICQQYFVLALYSICHYFNVRPEYLIGQAKVKNGHKLLFLC